MHQKPDFKTSFVALMEEQEVGDHPPAEALAAYRDGDLAAEEEARVRGHLLACRECMELARDLDLLTGARGSPASADRFEVAAFLRSLQPQLAANPPRAKTSWRFPLSVAASLVLAVVPLTWWLSRGSADRETFAQLSQPRPNVPIFDLYEDSSRRTGGPAEVRELRLDRGGMLILTPGGGETWARHEVRIYDSEDTLVWTVADLEPDPDDETFTLWIPPGGLAPGGYRLELHGRDGERAERIAVFFVEVVRASKPPS